MAKKHSTIIRAEKDGVEFFTVSKTGQSGMSITGVAIVCGLSKEAISKLLDNLSTKTASKWLKHLAGKELDLSTNAVKRGGRVRVLKAEVCSAIVRHYAFSGNERAQDFLCQLEDKAFEMFIQSVTGWQPPSEVQAFIDSHLLREARAWEVVFDRQWIRAAEQCTGWKWSYQAMGKLINLVIYDRLPAEVRRALDEYNPILEDGHRARKQHHYF